MPLESIQQKRSAMLSPVLQLIDIEKKFSQSGSEYLEIFSEVNLELLKGEMLGLYSPSGSGKTTLLQISGLLDSPTSGKLLINGVDTSKMNEAQRTLVRRKDIGFVYQFHHLLPEFSALENVSIPQWTAGVSFKVAKEKATFLLEKVGLVERLHHRPGELSGGEQQRVALCRALVNDPKILLADEPTGNLDPDTSDAVFEVLVSLIKESTLSAFVVSHNLRLVRQMDRVVQIHNKSLINFEF